MTKAELLTQREKIITAMNDILEGGQDFQTRTGRVRMVSYSTLQSRLAQIDTQLALMGDTTTGGTVMEEQLRITNIGGYFK